MWSIHGPTSCFTTQNENNFTRLVNRGGFELLQAFDNTEGFSLTLSRKNGIICLCIYEKI